jgi:hypothetical protein
MKAAVLRDFGDVFGEKGKFGDWLAEGASSCDMSTAVMIHPYLSTKYLK